LVNLDLGKLFHELMYFNPETSRGFKVQTLEDLILGSIDATFLIVEKSHELERFNDAYPKSYVRAIIYVLSCLNGSLH
jgi:hypothetical protein